MESVSPQSFSIEQFILRCAVASAAVLSLSPSAHAAAKEWDGGAAGTGNVWTTPANWDDDSVPNAASDVVLDNSGITGGGTIASPIGLSGTVGGVADGVANSLAFGSSSGTPLGAFTLQANVGAGITDGRTLTLTSGNITVDSSVTGTQTIGTIGTGNLTLDTAAVGFTFTNLSATQLLNVTALFAIGKAATFLNSGGGITLDTQLGAPTFASLSGGSGTLITNGGATAQILTLNAASGSTSFVGSINDGLGTLALTKSGAATQVLTGTNTYSAGTVVNAGTLIFGAASSIGGTGANVTVNGGSAVALQGATDIATIAPRLVTTSAGAIALDTNSSSVIDFNAAGLTAASLGAIGNVAFTGTLTPNGIDYRVGGGTGILSIGNTDAFTGGNNLNVVNGGTVAVNGTNSYTGTTKIYGNAAGVTSTLVIGSDNALPVATALTFGNGTATNTAAAAGGLGALDLSAASQAVGSLAVISNSTTANTITIGSGRTFTTSGGVIIGSVITNTTTRLTLTGPGSWVANNSGGTFQVGAFSTTTSLSSPGNAATLDMATLGTFTLNLGTTGTFRIGDTNTQSNTADTSTVILAANSTITAQKINIGDVGSSQQQVLKLGSGVNTLNADTFYIGSYSGFGAANGLRSSGFVGFNTGTGSLILRKSDGVGRAGLNIGIGTSTASSAPATNIFNVTGHSVDLLVSTLAIGNEPRNAAVTNTFSFDSGTLDADKVQLGFRSGTTNTAAANTSTINIGGGNVYIGNGPTTPGIAGGLDMANCTTTGGATGNNLNATVNVTGGTVSVANSAALAAAIRLVNNPATGGNTTATGTLNLTGGSLAVGGDIIKGASVRPAVAALVLDGGILNMGGHNIGTTNAIDTLTIASGTLENVAGFNSVAGGHSLLKTTAGILTLDGSNSYTGSTLVNAGTLVVAATGALTGSSSLSVANLATLELDNNISLNDSITLSLVTGAALNLNFNIGAETVKVLSLNGLLVGDGTYTAAQLTSLDNSITFSGNGSLTVMAVPEPETWALVFGGLGFIFWVRRLRA